MKLQVSLNTNIAFRLLRLNYIKLKYLLVICVQMLLNLPSLSFNSPSLFKVLAETRKRKWLLVGLLTPFIMPAQVISKEAGKSCFCKYSVIQRILRENFYR